MLNAHVLPPVTGGSSLFNASEATIPTGGAMIDLFSVVESYDFELIAEQFLATVQKMYPALLINITADRSALTEVYTIEVHDPSYAIPRERLTMIYYPTSRWFHAERRNYVNRTNSESRSTGNLVADLLTAVDRVWPELYREFVAINEKSRLIQVKVDPSISALAKEMRLDDVRMRIIMLLKHRQQRLEEEEWWKSL